MKIIEVENCWECPYRTETGGYIYCLQTHDAKETIEQLFKSCPLKDSKDE